MGAESKEGGGEAKNIWTAFCCESRWWPKAISNDGRRIRDIPATKKVAHALAKEVDGD